jgi:uncharacterized protein YraI
VLLGVIDASTGVQILGRDPGGSWYQISYEGSDSRRGWIAAEFVRVQDPEAVPIVGGGTEPTGTAREQVNVRNGPGTGFDAVGTLNPRDVVTLMGKDASGTWLQVKFAAGPDGKAWVAESFLDVTGAEGLPILDESGALAGTATAAPNLPAATPTAAVARGDDDSAAKPAVDIAFSPAGAGAFFYTDAVSAPDGDAADWFSFRTYGTEVIIELQCDGSGRMEAQLSQDGRSVAPEAGLGCGKRQRVQLEPGLAHVLELRVTAEAGETRAVQYTLSVLDVH